MTMKTKEMKTFEMNGIGYETDEETLNVLRNVVKAAKESGDNSAVAAVMGLGLKVGRIREPNEPENIGSTSFKTSLGKSK